MNTAALMPQKHQLGRQVRRIGSTCWLRTGRWTTTLNVRPGRAVQVPAGPKSSVRPSGRLACSALAPFTDLVRTAKTSRRCWGGPNRKWKRWATWATLEYTSAGLSPVPFRMRTDRVFPVSLLPRCCCLATEAWLCAWHLALHVPRPYLALCFAWPVSDPVFCTSHPFQQTSNYSQRATEASWWGSLSPYSASARWCTQLCTRRCSVERMCSPSWR
mmetsp:Transcript_43469/g.111174  ORF Transcript_43469/g.111174 Transcript_43469/m.111174 type:complete len:216 (+) Transcript_43469:138-785(+)